MHKRLEYHNPSLYDPASQLYSFVTIIGVKICQDSVTHSAGMLDPSRPCIPSFFPNVLEARGEGEGREGVCRRTRGSTAHIPILILSSYVCRLEPLAQGKVVYSFFVSQLRSFILFVDITILRFRKLFAQRFVEACHAAPTDLKESHTQGML